MAFFHGNEFKDRIKSESEQKLIAVDPKFSESFLPETHGQHDEGEEMRGWN